MMASASASATDTDGSGTAVPATPSGVCGLTLNPAMQYNKSATLSDIFGPSVQPGRELVDIITRTYQVQAKAKP